jgi:hypothetical protein
VYVMGNVGWGVEVGIKGSVAVGSGVGVAVAVAVGVARVGVGVGDERGVGVSVGLGAGSCLGIKGTIMVNMAKIMTNNEARTAVRRASSRTT